MNQVLSGIGIDGTCVNFQVNRHLAFYDIKLEPGSSVRKLKNRAEDIALGIRSKTNPIVKTIPEKGIVRIQVAIKDAEILPFYEFYQNSKEDVSDMTLPFLLGETNDGKEFWIDFKDNPHLLVAGGTGSGKSVFLHLLISNMMYLSKNNIRQTITYLIDPKRVEFNSYKNPELCQVIGGVYNTYIETIALLEYLVSVMEQRYSYMADFDLSFSSIEQYPNMFPSILVIIDEVSDLILQDKGFGKLQNLIIALAQKARAAGIYLVLSTQRPSIDVLTGLIKANFPGRVACKTASGTDSKVILDMMGAENLLGRGDALCRNMKHDLVRFQVAFTDSENNIENYLRNE